MTVYPRVIKPIFFLKEKKKKFSEEGFIAFAQIPVIDEVLALYIYFLR